MSLPDVVSREEWLVARKQLLAREKELTRAKDALNTARRELPMVRIEKDYRFDGPRRRSRAARPVRGSPPARVQHFMFDPHWEDGCPGCTADVEERSEGLIAHLESRETSLAVVSRAPLAKSRRTRRSEAGPSTGTPRSAATSTTTSTSRSTQAWPRSCTTTVMPTSSWRRPRRADAEQEPSLGATGLELLPARRRRDLPHLLDVRPRHRGARRRLRHPRPDGPRPAGGVGGAQGPRRAARALRPVLRGHCGARVVLVAHIFGIPVEESIGPLVAVAGTGLAIQVRTLRLRLRLRRANE